MQQSQGYAYIPAYLPLEPNHFTCSMLAQDLGVYLSCVLRIGILIFQDINKALIVSKILDIYLPIIVTCTVIWNIPDKFYPLPLNNPD